MRRRHKISSSRKFPYIHLVPTVAFKVYDMDRDDYISNGELFLVLKMMVGNNLKDGQLQQIVDKTIMEADKDGDGKLSFEEFVQMVSNTVRRSPICVRGRLLTTRGHIPGYCQANDIGGLVLGWFSRLFHIGSLWSCCVVFGCHVCCLFHPILAITITSLAYCRVYYLSVPAFIYNSRTQAIPTNLLRPCISGSRPRQGSIVSHGK